MFELCIPECRLKDGRLIQLIQQSILPCVLLMYTLMVIDRKGVPGGGGEGGGRLLTRGFLVQPVSACLCGCVTPPCCVVLSLPRSEEHTSELQSR